MVPKYKFTHENLSNVNKQLILNKLLKVNKFTDWRIFAKNRQIAPQITKLALFCSVNKQLIVNNCWWYFLSNSPNFTRNRQNGSFSPKIVKLDRKSPNCHFIAINCENGCGPNQTWLTLSFILPILTSSRVKAKLDLGFFFKLMLIWFETNFQTCLISIWWLWKLVLLAQWKKLRSLQKSVNGRLKVVP